ncbi:DDE-type integrase/transposase/recombinase [Treponema phagedenis]|nr:DDE-type integrase/transposase/recombinase [Treponema phagedenis]
MSIFGLPTSFACLRWSIRQNIVWNQHSKGRLRAAEALLHSDQGTTYTSHAYREKLTELGMIQSMSRRGNCWDNACIENFFGTIKCESGYYDTLKNGLLTYKQMEELIGKYIEFFNNERIQKKLGWKSPVDFRTQVA